MLEPTGCAAALDWVPWCVIRSGVRYEACVVIHRKGGGANLGADESVVRGVVLPQHHPVRYVHRQHSIPGTGGAFIGGVVCTNKPDPWKGLTYMFTKRAAREGNPRAFV